MAASPVTPNFLSDEDMAKLAPSSDGFVSDADMAKLGQEEQEFGSPLETIKAGAEGLARGATLGLSDLAETKLGISSPERVRKRKEYNPIASTGGEIAGTIGSTLLAPEMSLPGLVERGAAGLAERVTANMAVQSAAKKVASRALSDAAQGAAYGAGGLVSEQALGDHDLTAEQVMSTVGIGTLLGGAIGAGFAGAGVAAKKTLAAAKIPDILEKALGRGFSRIASVVTGKDQGEIEQVIANRPLATISDAQREVMQGNAYGNIKGQITDMDKFLADAAPLRARQREALLKQEFNGAVREEQLNQALGMHDLLRDTVKMFRENPDAFSATGKINQLERLADGLEKNLEFVGKRPEHLYEALDKLKQRIGTLAKFDLASSSQDKETVNAIKGVYHEMQQALEDHEVWGTVGHRQASFNAKYSSRQEALKGFMSEFGKKGIMENGKFGKDFNSNRFKVFAYNYDLAGNETREKALQNYLETTNDLASEMGQMHADIGTPAGAVSVPQLKLPEEEMNALRYSNMFRRLSTPWRVAGEKENLLGPHQVGNVLVPTLMGHPVVGAIAGALGLAAHPMSMVQKFTALEKVKDKGFQVLDHFIDATLAGKAPEMATVVATDLAGRQRLLNKRESEDTSADVFKKRLAEINELAQNPNVLTDRIAATTNSIQGVTGIQTALAGKLGTGLNYLAQTAPKDPNANSLMKKDWRPLPTDVMKFNRRLAAVQHPYSVLQNPTPEGIDALKNVYPSLYQEMAKRVVYRIANRPDSDVPYKAKLKLSRIFGLDLDRYGNGADIARLQASYAVQQEQPAKSSGGKQMKSATQTQTGTERIESKLT